MMEFNQPLLPVPVFYENPQLSGFSTKKSRTSKSIIRYHPVAKSAPPVSRVYPHRWISEKPHAISFKAPNDSFVSFSKHYDETNHDLFFDQCFIVEDKLGEGSFGEVFKVRSREDGKLYAVKRGREVFRSASDRLSKLSEVQKHEQLPAHSNLVEFIRAWEERGCLYIQTELCQSNLADFAEGLHDISENVIWDYLVDLLLALKHLHDYDLVHMDIKPENIFISRDDICKLGDFGLVFDLKRSPVCDAQEGDAKYLAPEILDGKFGKHNDIFSLGISILELCCDLDLPSRGEVWQQLRQGLLPDALVNHLSPEMQRIIRLMMHPDYRLRPTVDELLRLPCVERVCSRRRVLVACSRFIASVRAAFVVIWLYLSLLTSWLIGPLRHLLYRSNGVSVRQTFATPDHGETMPTKRLNFDHSFSDDDINDISSILNDSKGQGFEGLMLPPQSSPLDTSVNSHNYSDQNCSFPHCFSDHEDEQPLNSTPAQKSRNKPTILFRDTTSSPLSNSRSGKFRTPLQSGSNYDSPSRGESSTRHRPNLTGASLRSRANLAQSPSASAARRPPTEDSFQDELDANLPRSLAEVFEATSSDDDSDL